MDHIHPHYRPVEPEGFIHWDNVADEPPSISDRVASITSEYGIPLEDILIDSFVPTDGRNTPLIAIFVRARHEECASKRRLSTLSLLDCLRNMANHEGDSW